MILGCWLHFSWNNSALSTAEMLPQLLTDWMLWPDVPDSLAPNTSSLVPALPDWLSQKECRCYFKVTVGTKVTVLSEPGPSLVSAPSSRHPQNVQGSQRLGFPMTGTFKLVLFFVLWERTPDGQNANAWVSEQGNVDSEGRGPFGERLAATAVGKQVSKRTCGCQ